MKKETITLKHPIKHGDTEIKEVTWPKRMTAKDLLNAEGEMRARGITGAGEITQTFFIISRATGLEPEGLEKMDTTDYLPLVAKSKDFL
jgi:phage FluMu protein gp41